MKRIFAAIFFLVLTAFSLSAPAASAADVNPPAWLVGAWSPDVGAAVPGMDLEIAPGKISLMSGQMNLEDMASGGMELKESLEGDVYKVALEIAMQGVSIPGMEFVFERQGDGLKFTMASGGAGSPMAYKKKGGADTQETVVAEKQADAPAPPVESVGTADTEDSGDPDGLFTGLAVSAPNGNDILSIANKYYNRYAPATAASLKSDLKNDVGGVNFTGALNDATRAAKLCDTASVIAAFEGEGNYAVACAAAAVGWANRYAQGAGTLAAVLEQGGFISDANRLNDAKKLIEYAISLDGNYLGFYVTQAQILDDMGNTGGAINAINSALKLDSGNNAALNFKLGLLWKQGGPDGEIRNCGTALVDNDGELSGRDTEQEEATKGKEVPKAEESRETIIRKLDEILSLEPITPADMVEAAFPRQARELRQNVKKLTAEEKDALHLPEFPAELYRTAKHVMYNQEARSNYSIEFLMVKNANAYEIDLMFHASDPDIGYFPPSILLLAGQTPTGYDYMLEYNYNVLRAGIDGLVALGGRLSQERKDLAKPFRDEYYKISREYGDYLASHITEVLDREYIDQLKREMNAVNIRGTDALIPVYIEHYNIMKAEAQRVWETMLPFARATVEPMENTARLYERCVWLATLPINNADTITLGPFFEEVDPSPEQQMANEMALAAEQVSKEKAEAEKVKALIKAQAALEGLTVSVEIGPFELKLSANRIEAEYVNIVAVRAAFDWKSKQAEAGVGLGHKSSLGIVKGHGVGVEAKTYANLALDVRDGTITDLYMSAEAKGSWGAFEAGGQYRVSVYNNKGGWGLSNAGLSTAAKAKYGRFGVEHETSILGGD